MWGSPRFLEVEKGRGRTSNTNRVNSNQNAKILDISSNTTMHSIPISHVSSYSSLCMMTPWSTHYLQPLSPLSSVVASVMIPREVQNMSTVKPGKQDFSPHPSVRYYPRGYISRSLNAIAPGVNRGLVHRILRRTCILYTDTAVIV